MVKFASNFCSCAVDQEKAVFQWKRAVSGHSAFLGSCRPRKGRFSMETGRFWPICPFGARNGASNFCYYAVDQEKAVFQWKRAVSRPSALLGPEMVKFASNFCSCAVDQEKAVFQWKRAVSGPSALWGPEMVKFAPDFCYCAVDQEQAVFQWKRAVCGPSCPFGARNGQICSEFLLLCCIPRKSRFSMETGRFWSLCPLNPKS